MNYKSIDNRFAAELSEIIMDQMLKFIRNSGEKETGGILLGKYTQDHSVANISQITGPPPDSKSGPTWFVRKIKGLQSLLFKKWKNGEYYLGEWHFHPGGTPDPSNVDINQMVDIAVSSKYACPEPVLIIVGGMIEHFEIRSFVILKNRKIVALEAIDEV